MNRSRIGKRRGKGGVRESGWTGGLEEEGRKKNALCDSGADEDGQGTLSREIEDVDERLGEIRRKVKEYCLTP